MIKTFSTVACVAALMVSTSAFAQGNNGGGNGGCGVGQTTNGCGGTIGGNGGAGGAGGSAIQGQAQGQIQGQVQGQAQGQSQSSRNTNTNVNANSNSNKNNNANINANANSNRVSNRVSNTSTSSATGGSSNQSQTTSVNGAGANSNNYVEAANPVSSSYAPSFAIGQCQWAVSGGLSFFTVGASAGGAGMYEFCKGMMKAEHFRKVGRMDLAKAVECQHEDFRAAYKEAGTPCRVDVPKAEQPYTPIVQEPGRVYGPAPVVTASAAPQVPVPLAPNCKTQTVGDKSFITCE